MSNSLSPTAQMKLDLEFEVFSSDETIELSPAIIQQALNLSSKISNEQRQWQTYLNVLALGGFEEWLASRTTDLTLNSANCSVFKPALANALDAVAHLSVGEFKLCLLVTGSLTDEEVSLPRVLVDLPEFIPHFYVLVEVQEELETASIQGFLSYSQLQAQQDKQRLIPETDWTYSLPLTWFEGSPDDLLLNLRCLEPTAITLPEPDKERPMQLARMRSQLEALLPKLQSPDTELWQVLTWEQGAVVLTHPELLHWVYQIQHSSSPTPIASVQKHLADTLQLLTQPAVNAGRWLMGELDELAQELSWVLLPTVAPMRALRSPVEEFEAIVTQLRQKYEQIPLEARGAYRDLRLGGMPLRLYAVTWPLYSEATPEWTLLLILGAMPGTHLPLGVQLRVSDQTGILVQQVLDPQQQDSYFFTRVVGNLEEKFIVTVSLPSGIEQTLPPFSFNPEAR